ncbi:hypothetical protein KY284_024094 [Solanum tuberosum]|nr:hypothetical protein KY284_024094 [Solanum tuberosum]
MHNNLKNNICNPTSLNLTLEFIALTGKVSTSLKKRVIFVKWKPPSVGYKLNMDGSSMGNPGKGGIGGMIRNSNGNSIVGYRGNLFKINSIKAKLPALLHGMKLALEKELFPLEIILDCTEAISFITSNHRAYTNIIHDCALSGEAPNLA